MYSKVHSAVVYGVEGLHIEIEVKLSRGLPTYQIVGLPEKTVRESKERIRSAIEGAGFAFPAQRITLNLIPAETPKDGSQLDLPMAIGMLEAIGELSLPLSEPIACFGELTLDGRLMPTPGILSMCSAVKKAGIRYVIAPVELVEEASLVDGLHVFGAGSLHEVCVLLKSESPLERFSVKVIEPPPSSWKAPAVDFEEVQGQEAAKRGLMIAAAGFHNILISGPPGAGKSFMMQAWRDVLPPLDKAEAVEVRTIHSVREMNVSPGLSFKRPFRTPHHNVTAIALAGGGVKPRPGELTLAHRGVLFLDELPEYSKAALEAMRQPLEDKVVHLSRLNGTLKMPAHTLLAATMNPCRCGYLFSVDRPCTCSERDIKSYLGKLSGPLLDRIDILIEVQGVQIEPDRPKGMNSEEMHTKIQNAVRRQNIRYKGTNARFNSELSGKELDTFCIMSAQAEALLNRSVKAFSFSRRVQNKVRMLSMTIADLAGADLIDTVHVGEAIQYRLAESRLRRESL